MPIDPTDADKERAHRAVQDLRLEGYDDWTARLAAEFAAIRAETEAASAEREAAVRAAALEEAAGWHEGQAWACDERAEQVRRAYGPSDQVERIADLFAIDAFAHRRHAAAIRALIPAPQGNATGGGDA